MLLFLNSLSCFFTLHPPAAPRPRHPDRSARILPVSIPFNSLTDPGGRLLAGVLWPHCAGTSTNSRFLLWLIYRLISVLCLSIAWVFLGGLNVLLIRAGAGERSQDGAGKVPNPCFFGKDYSFIRSHWLKNKKPRHREGPSVVPAGETKVKSSVGRSGKKSKGSGEKRAASSSAGRTEEELSDSLSGDFLEVSRRSSCPSSMTYLLSLFPSFFPILLFLFARWESSYYSVVD